jgi:hypothetical protein
MSNYDTLLGSVNSLAERLQSLNRQAVRVYTPIVEDILRSRSRDVSHIEHTLDGILSVCGYGPALALFKKLCRYYWEIDAVATADYVNIYREMWDSEEEAQNAEEANAPVGGNA